MINGELSFPAQGTLPDAPALMWLDRISLQRRELSYEQYDVLSCYAVQWLLEQGFQRGDRCAFIAYTDLATVVLLLACLRSGIVAMPISPRFPSSTINVLVQTAGARLVHQSSWCTDNDLPVLSTHAATISHEQSQISIPSDQIATILCSSGSTGIPKMFVHTVGNHVWSARGAAENIPLSASDCWLASLPLYHVGGYAIVFRALVAGSAIALPHYTSFDVQKLYELIERLPVTHCSFVAAQLYYALRYAPLVQRLRQMRAILVGGSAIPKKLLEEALSYGLPVYTSYGCTEMASQITTARAPSIEHVRTSGNILPYREVWIADDGEIMVRGKTLAYGKITECGIVSITDSEGWYRTGDIGEFDNAQRLIVRGRRDNMFISGGENIHPESIEEILMECEDIVHAVVVPVVHDVYGYRPYAFVQRANNIPLDDTFVQNVRHVLSERLPRFALPDKILAIPQEMLDRGIKLSRGELAIAAQKKEWLSGNRRKYY
ncbi:MAG: o-succinylbenzoate--CoA ligase [Bacteroidota bacterium]|nr:o-succinylbenzoate--CoA ligase [Candidatus Kapabacteria bacterium]MDW8220371.1 o-succinylbenzoate--CoA ligase [Bacteroidota bacterium]